MKKTLFLSLLFVFGLRAHAQEANETRRSVASLSYTSIGLGFVTWNQNLHLEQGSTKVSTPANYQGMTINVQRETIYRRWGWSITGIIGSGRANGGDVFDPDIPYAETKQAWTMFGLSPRLFYRLSNRVNLGVSTPLLATQIEWPVTMAGVSVDGGKKFLTSAMADFTVKLGNKWDLYQGIGPASTDGETLWRLTLNYRL